MFETVQSFQLANSEIIFLPDFFDLTKANQLFQNLIEQIAWQQGEIKIFGKKIMEPRLSAWYGDEGKNYTYSGKLQYPLAWNEPLLDIKQSIENQLNSLNLSSQKPQNTPHRGKEGVYFNSVLCNLYRDGQDSMGWHSDNEPELGKNPLIASVNLGDTRRFLFKQKENYKEKYEIALTHGSLLIMAGEMQHHWLHAVPKEKNKKQRINLTFRYIY